MSRRWLLAGAALLAAACAPVEAEEKLVLDLGDLEDYAEWYAYEREEAPEPEPEPFEADPLVVTAIGKVRAVPDIAVITATVAEENANESLALDVVSGRINAVQAALASQTVETGFTALQSRPDYDQACLNANAAARQRHREIVNDYGFNKRLDDQGDTETRRRPPKPRLAARVCQAQAIRVSTDMVVRVSPAEAAGEVLRALGDAGAERARLYGYDFSNFDTLYAQAADKAVTQARQKAETVANGAGGSLGEIVEMSVSAPDRLGRFGPQPTVIRPPRPSSGDGVTALEAYQDRLDDPKDRYGRYSAVPPPLPVVAMEPDAVADEIIVTASRRTPQRGATPVSVSGLIAEKASAPGPSTTVGGPVGGGATLGSNALTMSLMSGPQTVEVAARLAFAYPTPLDGIVIQEPDDD